MNYYEQIHEDLREAIEDLGEANATRPVIVEGERDVRALRQLGLAGEVVSLNAGIPLFNLAESVARRAPEVVILTDWDHRGGKLCRLLMDAFEANGVRANTEIRARLARLTKKEIKDVESLASLVERVAREVEGGWHGKTSKHYYAGRKSGAVRARRARRILAKSAPKRDL